MGRRAEHNEVMSIDAYLEFEMASDRRHEYVEGRVYAMSGAHSRHNRIAGNIFGRLREATRGGSCRTYVSEIKVRTPNDRVYYPDVMAVCTPRDDDGYVIDDPCLVVEVASPSTWRVDRFEKQPAYALIPSLTTFLLVEQHGRQVDRWWRTDGGGWERETVIESGDVFVPCPGLTLTLDEIYEGIAMPPVPLRRIYEPALAYDV